MSQFYCDSSRSWVSVATFFTMTGVLLGGLLTPTIARAIDDRSLVSADGTAVTATERPRVRIGIVLTPYHEMQVRERDGRLVTRNIPDKAMNYTLRALVDDVNHFYIGNYHIETQPLAYNSANQAYSVRVGVWQRFGDDGSIEEKIGHTDVAGTLVRHPADHVYVLNGVSSTTFSNGHGQPLVALMAGYKAPGIPGVSNSQPALLSKDVIREGAPAAK